MSPSIGGTIIVAACRMASAGPATGPSVYDSAAIESASTDIAAKTRGALVDERKHSTVLRVKISRKSSEKNAVE